MQQAPEQTGVSTHCPYCAFQCGMNMTGPRERAAVTGNEAFPVNRGALCVKGWTSIETLGHPDRLLTPLARNPEGDLQLVTWDEALT
jgi:assimilatory nitrate reductase catalytic subunit